MNSMYKPNISSTEKLVSTVAGAALAIAGLKRSNSMLGLAGLGLVARGVSGFCPVNAAMGRDTASSDTRRNLSGSRGVRVESSTTIYRPVQEVYSYWRQFENLPRFMDHLESVTVLDENRSHWVAKAPAGTRVEWDATIHNELENQLIAWRSLAGADVNNAGSVHFTPEGNGASTEVRVVLSYDPPAGRLGAAVAKLFGEEPSQQVEDDLRRFKQVMEAAEVVAPRPA